MPGTSYIQADVSYLNPCLKAKYGFYDNIYVTDSYIQAFKLRKILTELSPLFLPKKVTMNADYFIKLSLKL